MRERRINRHYDALSGGGLQAGAWKNVPVGRRAGNIFIAHILGRPSGLGEVMCGNALPTACAVGY